MKGSRPVQLVFLWLILTAFLRPVPARAGAPPLDTLACDEPYKLVRGDALSKIAKRCGLSLSALLMANPRIKNPGRIYAGQTIFFPRRPQPVDEENPTLVIRPAEDRLTPRQIDRLGIEPGSQEAWIDVDLSSQTVSAYQGQAAVRTFLVSTGTWKSPTVTGHFWIQHKYETDDMRGPGYDLKDVPYTMYFYKSYGLHGTYWHHNFGTPMSHGCVNLSVEDARWLYQFAQVGTMVNVHY